MNDRQFFRNVGRIPRLKFHIARLNNIPNPGPGAQKRIDGMNAELTRRKYEMLAAGYDALLTELESLNLTPGKDLEFDRLNEIIQRERVKRHPVSDEPPVE